MLLRWLLVGLCLYAGVLLLLAVFQSRLLYFPSREMDPPGTLPAEDVWMTSTNNTKIHGWWIPKKNANLTFLICHGNAGNLSHRRGLLAELRQRFSANLLIFDYQGYGRSQGSPTEAGTYDDSKAAWKYLVETLKIPAGQIVIYGRSLGTSIAAYLSTQTKPGALILDSPFSSFVDVAAEHYPWVPVRWIARIKYPTAKYVGQRTCPLLVIHSKEDEVIPLHLAQKCYQRAREPKDWLEIRGTHNNGFYQSLDEYMKKVQEFLNQTVLKR